MNLKCLLLPFFICALTASPVIAVTYTVTCPASPQFTLLALQVYDSANSGPLPGGEDLNTVLQNFNVGGIADGSLFYQFTTVVGSTPTITVYTIDSSLSTGPGDPGWANANDTAMVPPPKLHLGDGAIFFNSSGSPLSITFSGNVLSVEPPVTVSASTWYLRGRQVPSTVSCGTTAASWQDLMQNSPPAFQESVYDYNGGAFFLPWLNSANYNIFNWNPSVWAPASPGFCLGIGQSVFIGPPTSGGSTSSATISGTIYQGTTCAATTPLMNWTVAALNTATTVNYFGISDASGNYSIQVPAGHYVVSSFNPPVGWNQVCGGPYSITTVAGGSYPGNNFREHSTVAGRDLAVDLVSFFPYPLRSPCCGQNMTYVISYRNAGSTILNGVQVKLHFPIPPQTYVAGSDISVPPHSPGVGFTPRTWTIGTLLPHTSGNIKFTVTLPATPCSGPITATAQSTFPGWATLDVHPGDNTRSLNQNITCSHDPNDMLVDPVGCGTQGYIPVNQQLTYLVKFQNTGLGAASLVVISNLLSANLDVSTLQVIGSSHPNALQIQGNQLVWTFPNINLPPQSVDDLGSQGYVKYQVTPLATDPVGAAITNNAAIYFDLNAPVITVTTTNTVSASPEPAASFSVTPLVGSAGQTNNFTYTGGSAGATYLWDFGPNAIPATSTAQNPAGVIFTAPGDQMVNLQVSLGDCPSDPAVQIVSVGVPTLNAQVVDGQLVLSWEGNGYHLQERGDLNPATVWTATSATMTQIDSDFATTLPLDRTEKYYRLSQVAP